MNIQQLLELTIARKASDLHLVVGYPPTIRIHGELVPVMGTQPLSDTDMTGLILSLLTPTQKQIYDATFELDFAVAFSTTARFRVNIFRQQNHLTAAFRLIPITIPELDTLGLPPVVPKLVELRQGLILVTGPTGHGKSTSLASMINRINLTRPAHVITIEDPIEYVYPRGKSVISQREMYLDTKSWTNSLRSALREDPDVVLVGEMRDYETIASTITIAETGHLVLATLHTNSASQTVDRIIDIFPQNQQPQVRSQLSSVLEAVISQRLIPTIVPGRTLAVELLLKTPALGELIRSGKTHLVDNLIQTSGELGMVNLETSLAKLVKEGRVAFDKAQGYALRPDLLAKLAGG